MTPETAPAHDAWSPWHPAELARRLNGISRPWCIVGGWALDLWHGYRTRDHDDLEFTVLRDDLSFFRQALRGMHFFTAGDGIVSPLAAHAEPSAEISQIWCLEEGRWRVDMMIEPGMPETWVYKRDAAIFRARAEMVGTTPDGLPYLKPAAILLFKAKHRRAKDEVDFENALPKLAATERIWLKNCLETTHPGHEWALRL